jgi:hypothetical protein
VSLTDNQEKYLLRALSNTAAISSIILEECTSKQHTKTDDVNKTTWNTMGGHVTTDKSGLVIFSLPVFNHKKQSLG